MKKILILANNDIGLYKFRKELIIELQENYHVILSLPNGSFVSKLINEKCEFIETKIDRRGTNPIKDLCLLFKYMKILKNVKPDLVLTYTIKPNIFGGIASRLYKVPYISNITGLGTGLEKKVFCKKLLIFMYRISLNNCNCTFFQNKENLDFMLDRKIIHKNYRLIPGSGVNIQYFTYQEYQYSDKLNFLFVSRIMKEKGIDQYINAAKVLRKKYPNTEFHIVGFCEENYLNILNELSISGIIIYHGMQEDVRPFYKMAHCIVHPTYYPEGMSNVLLESASTGRPIITTNRSGCKEIVNDGVNGYLVKERDFDDIIDKIEKFIKLSFEEKRRMGLEGRLKIENDFDRKYVTNSYLDEIKKILGGY